MSTMPVVWTGRQDTAKMKLSHELLAEFVTCLRQDLRDGLAHERRALPRFKVAAPLRITPLTDDTPGTAYRVWVRDVSRGGVGIMYPRPLSQGDAFLISFPVLSGDPQWFVCEVVYCAGSLEEMFSIGIKFVQRWDPSAGKRIPPASEASESNARSSAG